MMSVVSASGTDIAAGQITVRGFGAVPAAKDTAAQGRMPARRAAMLDGYRQLAEIVQGVRVDAQTTVRNMQAVNDEVNTRVDNLVKGAQLAEEVFNPGVGYEIVLTLPVFGVEGCLAEALLTPQATEPVPTVEGAFYKGGYTGVVVDCSGLSLATAMSPVIFNDLGQKIYGYQHLDYQQVISCGVAGYVYHGEEYGRAGAQPLYLKAVRVEGGVNPVLTRADSDRLLAENQQTHFLELGNVVFIR